MGADYTKSYSQVPESNGLSGSTDSSDRGMVQANAMNSGSIEITSLSLPRGGGAIRGIDEKFQVNAATGTFSFGIPIPMSPSRNGFVPAIGLSYDSGSGNSPFGLGWDLGVSSIVRKTEQKLPEYRDEEESDTFVLSGSEDLVPVLEKLVSGEWQRSVKPVTENGINYWVRAYRPRIEGLFARIEKWQVQETRETHWRTVTRNNTHAYYGLTDESRISDPLDSTRVFEWMLCRTHDDKGNLAINFFKKEDFQGIDKMLNEEHRIGNCTQTYLKKVVYGNRTPYYLGDAVPVETEFLFKVIFDFGEHDTAVNIPIDIDVEKNVWTCRKDSFSVYRSGFEIRTYRRCTRVLFFHCFDTTELPHSPYLVKSLQLFYDDDLQLTGLGSTVQGFSFLVRARQNGHLWDANSNFYSTKYLPETGVNYQQHEWNTEMQVVSPENLSQAPAGLADKKYLWVDLFSEGISGILTEQAGELFYKSNLGGGNFSRALPVAPKPSFSGITTGMLSIEELEGNGVKYLVQRQTEPRGFFKITDDKLWEPMKSFSYLPNVDLRDPNLRPIDLNGDGMADLLITEDNQFRWYPARGEMGFDVSQTVAREIDEESGPAIVFADRDLSIFLADMSGDGLADIVRIRNGEICYWPNLGYGKFGAKVGMDNAPFFDHPDSFNPAFLRLADIDGSGTTDVIYLGKNDFRVWMNLDGNQWAPGPQIINEFPPVDNLSAVDVLDFLGSGTACIVYSSPLSNQPLRYIDLMGSKKPGLLIGYQNNCGKEVSISYKPSTYYYLKDKLAGNNWITKLPFPVHCVSCVRTQDLVRQTIYSNSFSYRHGYFDHYEKEFRGFARVEQVDTEDFEQFKLNDAKNVVEEDLHQPPVRTVSWFHTGALIRNEKILHQCEREYFQNNLFTEYSIPEPLIPEGLSAGELREALRACKGLLLRNEVYGQDDSPQAEFPYTASQTSAEIRLIQPRSSNKYASFLVIPSESISYAYERNPADPRISQAFVLDSDELGNATKSASIIYPRVARPLGENAVPDQVWTDQNKLHIGYGEALFTNDVLQDSVYRLRVGYESKLYEVFGLIQPGSFFFRKSDITAGIQQINADPAKEILYEVDFDGSLQKRLSSHRRQYFMKDDLSGPLPLGQLSLLGIPEKSYSLAFTQNLVKKYYGDKVTDQMLTDAKYVHSEGDQDWWTQSGDYVYPANPQAVFYMPVGTRDVLGNENLVTLDAYVLLVSKTTDAIGNFSTAVNDYRTLSPVLITDPNLNRGAVQTDELGLVIKSAVMGKEGSSDGDTLDDPTTKMEYDLFNWANNNQPNYVHTLARELHGPSNTRWQESYLYTDGGGKVIMSKTQAEPGEASVWNPVTKQEDRVQANPRWVGSGRTIYNNKGNPVKKYEPYFSAGFNYESEQALVETGMTAILFYDPVGRNIKTQYPNTTFSKIEFDAWLFKAYDLNDTVKDSQWYVNRGSPDPLGPEPSDPQTRAAWLAAQHYGTPGIAHSDSRGKTTYSVSDYGGGKTTSVYMVTDLAGRYSLVYDQLNRNISALYTNMLGESIYEKTAEKGERWLFKDTLGRMARIWDNNLRELYPTYDNLQRPVSKFVKEGATETLFEHFVYGDSFSSADAITKNIKGRPYQIYDQAGVITITNADFKGNTLGVERKLALQYSQVTSWNPLDGLNDIAAIETAAAPLLETESFISSTVLDALDRPVTLTLPDNSVIRPEYNEGNYLGSLDINIRGQGSFTNFLASQDYDAKGQRLYAKYGNGTITNYYYDPQTFKLVNLVTRLMDSDTPAQSIQDITFTFDPIGNVTQIRDDAQQTHFFKNAAVYPENKFVYDSVNQLLSATGREHAGLGSDTQRNNQDQPFVQPVPFENDAVAVRNYSEQYIYDDCGNIKSLKHIATNASWTQNYQYEYEVDGTNASNRLKATSLPGDGNGVFSATYTHDLHGNMTSMPHLPAANSMSWNFLDQLSEVDLGGGGTAYYVYGADGNRVRKIIERQGGLKTERIYLGALEIYRETQSKDEPNLERYTLHVADSTGRIAQVDTKTIDQNNKDKLNLLNEDNIRYQYSNHLDSALLETDDQANIISYEEYHPYGTSSYRISSPANDISLKRYRFTCKERDDETGFYYFGARYYANWLARWTSSDPANFTDGINLFSYCRNNPVSLADPDGQDSSARSFKLKSDNPRDLKAEVLNLGYRWSSGKKDQDGNLIYDNPLPRNTKSGWHFGTFDPDHIPDNDPLQILGGPALGTGGQGTGQKGQGQGDDEKKAKAKTGDDPDGGQTGGGGSGTDTSGGTDSGAGKDGGTGTQTGGTGTNQGGNGSGSGESGTEPGDGGTDAGDGKESGSGGTGAGQGKTPGTGSTSGSGQGGAGGTGSGAGQGADGSGGGSGTGSGSGGGSGSTSGSGNSGGGGGGGDGFLSWLPDIVQDIILVVAVVALVFIAVAVIGIAVTFVSTVWASGFTAAGLYTATQLAAAEATPLIAGFLGIGAVGSASGLVGEAEAAPGVYDLEMAEGRYIGQSVNIFRRIGQHFGLGGKLSGLTRTNSRFYYMPGSTKLEREVYEQYLIDKANINKLLNIVNPMGGRRALYESLKNAVINKFNLPL